MTLQASLGEDQNLKAPLCMHRAPEGSCHKALPVSSPDNAGEKHQLKTERSIFSRNFLVHFRGLVSFHCPARSPGAESYSNCWAGPRGTAGPQRECGGCHSIRAGSVAVGRCGRSVTEEAASPSPGSQECNLTSLGPLPARQRGHPLAPPRQTSLSAPK